MSERDRIPEERLTQSANANPHACPENLQRPRVGGGGSRPLIRTRKMTPPGILSFVLKSKAQRLESKISVQWTEQGLKPP